MNAARLARMADGNRRVIRRLGSAEEIVVAAIGRPWDSVRCAESGEIVPRVGPLRIDTSTYYATQNAVLWLATLRTGRLRRRRAVVRMFGSPSTNLTVLTLTPTRPKRRASHVFLERGLRSMTDLRDRLDAELASSTQDAAPLSANQSSSSSPPM